MKEFLIAFSVEAKKTVKSMVFKGSLFFAVFVAFMVGLLFFIVKNPAFAQASAIIRAKASIVGTADWATFSSVLTLLIAIIGVIAFGFITSWIFGREYSEKTLKDILALPVSRVNIVLSKFVVIFIWSLLMAIIIYVFSIIMGLWIDLGNWDIKEIFCGLKRFAVVTLMNIILTSVIGFLASYGRGYILPLAFIFFILLVSNFAINISENSRYIPWAIPLLYAGATLKEGLVINTTSIIVLLLTGLAGLIATILWYRFADQY